MKSFIKNYLNFSARERIGVLTLLFLIILLKILPLFYEPVPFAGPETLERLKNKVAAAEAKYQEIKAESAEPEEETTTSLSGNFNPNHLNEKEWITLGISAKLAARIMKYKTAGGRFRTAADLKKIYGFPQQLIKRYEKQMLFEVETAEPEKETQKEAVQLLELNSCDSAELEKLPGLGGYSVRKILQYRGRLGGYCRMEQLLEIKGISPENFSKFKNSLNLDMTKIEKLKINSSDASSLSRHPYISRKQAQALVSYREQHGKYSGENDLSKLPVFSGEELLRLLPYLSFD